MVKVFGPLFSADAEGSMGDAITFKKVEIQNYASKKRNYFRICIDRRTFWQRNHAHTVETWHQLKDIDKLQWNLWAERNNYMWSGFNAFYAHYMVALNVGDVPHWWPPA